MGTETAAEYPIHNKTDVDQSYFKVRFMPDRMN